MGTYKRFNDIILQRDVLMDKTLYEDGVIGYKYYIMIKKNEKSAWVYRCDEDGKVLEDYIYSGFDRVPILQKPERKPRGRIPRLVHKTLDDKIECQK